MKGDEATEGIARRSIEALAALHGLEVVPVRSAQSVEETPRPTPAGRLSTALAWLRASEIRGALLGNMLGGDPAWDILLDLYVRHRRGVPVLVADAGVTAMIPPTTAIRWLAALEAQGWATRVPDPHDRKKLYVRLTERAIASIESALDAVVDSDSRLGLRRMTFE